MSTTKPCPYCAEVIQEAARLCRFCNKDLTIDVQPPAKKQAFGQQKVHPVVAILVLFTVFGGWSLFGQVSSGYNEEHIRSGGISVPASVAQQTVTKSNYDSLRTGMSYAEAISIIGQSGSENASNHMDGVSGVVPSVDTKMYSWQNVDGSNMNAMFQNDKMINKAQFGLQ